MTETEKMIWAAAYVAKLFSQPAGVPDEERASTAAAAAQKAVCLLQLAACPDGEHNCTTAMMLAVVRDELPNRACHRCAEVVPHADPVCVRTPEEVVADRFGTWALTPAGQQVVVDDKEHDIAQQAFLAGWAFATSEMTGDIEPIMNIIGTGVETFGERVRALENAQEMILARKADKHVAAEVASKVRQQWISAGRPGIEVVGCSPAEIDEEVLDRR